MPQYQIFQIPFFGIEGVSGNLTLKIHNMNEKDPYTAGELVTITPRLGKRVAVGQVIKTEKVDDLTNFSIQPVEVKDWDDGFIRELSIQNQEIYVMVFRQPSLAIEVATGNPTKPRPTDLTHFSLALDKNGDGTVTDVEALKFVKNALGVRNGAGLSFKDLAGGIPPTLNVTRVSVNSPSVEMIHFNGLAVRVVYDRRSSRPILYVPLKFADLIGPGTWPYLDDAIQIRFSDFMDEVQNNVPGLSQRLYPGSKEPGWQSNSYTLTVIDKIAGNIIVNGEEIASIKKVKKCNKCYYKIELVETGLVPSINAGSYQNCLLSFEKFAMRLPPFTC
jgi:hypothetical protein